MQFLVIGRLIETPVVPPDLEIALLKASFEYFQSGQDPRIKAVYPLVDQRATAFVVEADSADDLGSLLNGLPGSRLSTFEAHPIGTVQAVLEVLSQWEQALPDQPRQ